MLLQWGFFLSFLNSSSCSSLHFCPLPSDSHSHCQLCICKQVHGFEGLQNNSNQARTGCVISLNSNLGITERFFLSLKILKVNKLRLDKKKTTSFHFGECKEQPENASCDISTCKCSVEQAVEDEDSLVRFKTVLSRINTNSRKRQDDFRLWQELEPAIDWGAGKKIPLLKFLKWGTCF